VENLKLADLLAKVHVLPGVTLFEAEVALQLLEERVDLALLVPGKAQLEDLLLFRLDRLLDQLEDGLVLLQDPCFERVLERLKVPEQLVNVLAGVRLREDLTEDIELQADGFRALGVHNLLEREIE